VRDLAEQPGVLHRHRRLVGEGPEQLDDLRPKRPRRLPGNRQGTDDLFVAQQRNDEKRPIPGVKESVAHARLITRVLDVGNLCRLTRQPGMSERTLAFSYRRPAQRSEEVPIEDLRRAEVEIPGPDVIFAYRSS